MAVLQKREIWPDEQELAQKYQIDLERVTSAVDAERSQIGGSGLKQLGLAFAVVVDRLERIGQPERPVNPTCTHCSCEYEPETGCGCFLHPAPGREWHGYLEYYKGGGLVGKGRCEEKLIAQESDPLLELWVCERCGNLPQAEDKGSGSRSIHRFLISCEPCGFHSGTNASLELAGQEWNKHFGRKPRSEVVDEDHVLYRCECGQLPSPVAFLWQGGPNNTHWIWGIQCRACGSEHTGGWSSFDGVKVRWNKGGRHVGKNVDRSSFRYDIPTHVTLGTSKLPEKYRSTNR